MRTRKIYYLETSVNTYMKRHDLYNAGVRWDGKAKRWWASTPGPVRKAAEMVGGQAVAVHVQSLPKISKTFRGGRPRMPRGNGNGQEQATAAEQPAQAPVVPPALAIAEGGNMVATGQPFVRGRATMDRRQSPDRRNEGTRPDAVLVVPMARQQELPPDTSMYQPEQSRRLQEA